MPEKLNINKWMAEIPRLIDESAEHMTAGDPERALSLLDRAEDYIARVREGTRLFERSRTLTPEQAEKVYYGLEVSRARKDTSRAMIIGSMGRTREAKRLLGDVYQRTNLPDQFAFGAMVNLVGIHHLEGEKRLAWDAFRQAEKLAKRMGPDASVSSHLELIRRRLARTFGQPPKRRRHRRK